MATHSSTLAWKTPWTEEPGRLQSTGLKRVSHNWVTSLSLSFSNLSWALNDGQDWIKWVQREGLWGLREGCQRSSGRNKTFWGDSSHWLKQKVYLGLCLGSFWLFSKQTKSFQFNDYIYLPLENGICILNKQGSIFNSKEWTPGGGTSGTRDGLMRKVVFYFFLFLSFCTSQSPAFHRLALIGCVLHFSSQPGMG